MNEEELKFEETYGQHTKPKEFTDFKCPDCGYCFSDTLNKFYNKDKIKCECGAYLMLSKKFLGYTYAITKIKEK
jgi:hypothetical protein